MIIGTPKEIKNHEYRVGLTPESARELVVHGHRVLVQTGAGEGIGAHDRYYVEAGAEIVQTAEEIFATCEMVVKVKEPQPVERAMLRPGQILYTYLHLAPDPDQTRDLMASGARCASPMKPSPAPHGGLPLLKPMSRGRGPHVDPGRCHCARKGRMAAAACSSAASPASHRARSA